MLVELFGLIILSGKIERKLTGKHDVTAEYAEPRVGDVRHSLADITMARELLGYESKVDLREGLQRMGRSDLIGSGEHHLVPRHDAGNRSLAIAERRRHAAMAE